MAAYLFDCSYLSVVIPGRDEVARDDVPLHKRRI